jgi:hypothetical protein
MTIGAFMTKALLLLTTLGLTVVANAGSFTASVSDPNPVRAKYLCVQNLIQQVFSRVQSIDLKDVTVAVRDMQMYSQRSFATVVFNAEPDSYFFKFTARDSEGHEFPGKIGAELTKAIPPVDWRTGLILPYDTNEIRCRTSSFSDDTQEFLYLNNTGKDNNFVLTASYYQNLKHARIYAPVYPFKTEDIELPDDDSYFTPAATIAIPPPKNH